MKKLSETPAVRLAALGRYLCFWLGVVFAGTPASAWTIDPLLWQQLVERAQFVGVVECTTAGGIVARYRVVEVWKGREAPGEEIAICISYNFLEQGYPVAVVGERAFVTLFRSEPPPPVLEMTGDGMAMEPTARRNLPSDYHIPLGQGYYELSSTGISARDEALRLDREPVTLADLRNDATDFLASSEDARAQALLRALIDKYLARSPQLAESHDRIKGLKSSEAILEALRELWDANDNRGRSLIERLIEQCAESTRGRMRELARSTRDVRHTIAKGETLSGIALKYLGSRGEASKIQTSNRDVVASMDNIKVGATIDVSARQGLVSACLTVPFKPSQPTSPPPATVSAVDIDEAERIFLSTPEHSQEFSRAASLLINHRPTLVTAWLKKWTALPSHRWEINRSYELGSWFAANCGGDRKKSLAEMSEAVDSVVRTAAAVYLTFEDQPQGLARLRTLSVLSGDAGAWAAVTLMRYGDRTAIPRALQLLETRPETETRRTQLQSVLTGRLYEILSNTAAANNLPAKLLVEKLPEEVGDDAWRRKVAAWAKDLFAKNPRVVPVDPWLPELRRRKVD